MLLERYTYSAFGIPTFYNAAGAIIYNAAGISQSALGIRHLFQGQLWTQETGLNDYRNRVELPAMGVFLQPDPIGFKGDAANIYRFCNNNAVNRIDPLGLLVMDHLLGDRMWNMACFADSGNSFQGSLVDFLKRILPAGMGGGDSDKKSISAENEGKKKQPFVKTTAKYEGGEAAIKEAQGFMRYYHPKMKVDKYWTFDVRIPKIMGTNGYAIPGGIILLDTNQMSSYREVVTVLYHELLHKAEGFIKAQLNTPEQHNEHVYEAEKIGEQYFYLNNGSQ